MTELHRRSILGGTAMAAFALAAAPGRAARNGNAVRGLPIESVADLRALAALPESVPGCLIYLAESGREGLFRGVSGNAPIGDDPLQGLIISSRSPGFHYAREWDGTHGRPEWFGARPGDRTADCADAIEACHRLCPVTELAQADYFLRRTLHLSHSWRTVRGVAGNATGEARGTRLIVSASAPGAASMDALVIGPTTKPASAEGMTSDSHFSGFAVMREAACTPHPSGDITRYPTGLRAHYLAHCTFRDIASLESSVGFYIGGVVYTKFDDCLSQRLRAGTSARGDRMIGFYLDGHIVFGYSGGNASLYMNRCLVADQHAQHVDPTALLAKGAFVDSFLDRFESARIATGMAFHVDGALAATQTIDLHIRNPILDGCSRHGIEIDLGLTSSCSIEIFDPYIASAGGGGQHGIFVHDGAGLVTITGGQIHGEFAAGSVYLSRTRGIRLVGTKIHQSLRPLVVAEASGLLLEPQINNYQKTAPGFAVQCRALSRSIVRPVVIGAAGPAFHGGISLDSASDHSEIDGTGIDPGCFVVGDARYKTCFGGKDARSGAAGAAFLAAGNVLAGVRD